MADSPVHQTSDSEQPKLEPSCWSRCMSILFPHRSTASMSNRKMVTYRMIITVLLLLSLSLLLSIALLSVIASFMNAPHLPTVNNGVSKIVEDWKGPSSSTTLLDSIPSDFNLAVSPIPCHSHNDYTRRVPLYEALSMGCVSVEADVYLPDDKYSSEHNLPNDTLLVSHKRNSVKPHRTLSQLYTSPLYTILNSLDKFNNTTDSSTTPPGIFQSSPLQTLVLLVDFKETTSTSLQSCWDRLQSHLQPFRASNYLTASAANGTLINRPLTIVASGRLPFSTVTNIRQNSHRDIFFDAPLDKLTKATSPYNSSNSYYASAKLPSSPALLPRPHFSGSSSQQVTNQISVADNLGLRARYWDTPTWPRGMRDYVWTHLLQTGTGVVNVDDVEEFGGWIWNSGAWSLGVACQKSQWRATGC